MLLAGCRPNPDGQREPTDVRGVEERPAEGIAQDLARRNASSLTALPVPVEAGLQQAQAMEANRDRRCLRKYVELLESSDFEMRWRAMDRLHALTGESLEFYASAEEAEREKALLRWREWVEANESSAEIIWAQAPEQYKCDGSLGVEGVVLGQKQFG